MDIAAMKRAKISFNRNSLRVIGVGAFCFAILGISCINVVNIYKQPKVVTLSEDEYRLEYSFWVDFIKKHPSYYPAYIEISKLENMREENKMSRVLLNEAKRINPNSISLD
jgi:hypothetical protein